MKLYRKNYKIYKKYCYCRNFRICEYLFSEFLINRIILTDVKSRFTSTITSNMQISIKLLLNVFVVFSMTIYMYLTNSRIC